MTIHIHLFGSRRLLKRLNHLEKLMTDLNQTLTDAVQAVGDAEAAAEARVAAEEQAFKDLIAQLQGQVASGSVSAETAQAAIDKLTALKAKLDAFVAPAPAPEPAPEAPPAA